MTPSPIVTTVASADLSATQRQQIAALCSRAYDEDFAPVLAAFPAATHVLAWENDCLVSHALWVTRWLQAGEGSLLRTAFVEAVATEPQQQGRGYATLVLRRLAEEIQDFDVGALSPSDPAFYARLRWELWRGPLATRTERGVVATPDEQVMILRLPASPSLDLTMPLSVEWRAGEVW